MYEVFVRETISMLISFTLKNLYCKSNHILVNSMVTTIVYYEQDKIKFVPSNHFSRITKS